MNPMNPKRTRRLRARAATMNSAEEYDDYGPEPNMKLSHAFLVVLMLHVIAVAGLYAFNSMKVAKVPATKVAKIAPLPPSGSTQEPSGNQGNSSGGSGQKPPSEVKTPLVAKVAEAPKAAKPATSAAKSAEVAQSQNNAGGAKGLLASAKGVLAKAAGVGVAATGVSKAGAQSPAPEASNAVTPAESAPAATSTNKTYMVRAGDTMTRIASSLGVAIPDLEKINGMTEKSVIQVGQILKVPEKVITQAAAGVATGVGNVAESVTKLPGAVSSVVSGVASTNSNAVAADTASGPMTEYTVVKGDSPYKIAKKFKITPDELMKANGITDPKKIQIGQQLKIPASTVKKGK